MIPLISLKRRSLWLQEVLISINGGEHAPVCCVHTIFWRPPTCILIGCTLTLSHSSKLVKYWISIENAFIAKTCMFVIGSWEVGRREEDKRRGRRTEKNGGRTIKTARRISASWAWKTKTSDRGKNYYLKVNNTKTSVRQFNFGIYFNHCLE